MKKYVGFYKILISAVFFSLLLSSAVFAAEPACVPLARKAYSEINDLISSGKTRTVSVEFPWYSAPHAIVRTTKTKFFFTEKTELDEYDFPATKLQLLKAVITHQFGNEKPMETDEFYFSDGSLLFYYSAADITEEAVNDHNEYRFYFDNGRLMRGIEDIKPINGKEGKPVKTQLDSDFTPEMTECSNNALKKAGQLNEIFMTLDKIKGFN